MINNPFGLPVSPYGWDEEVEEVQADCYVQESPYTEGDIRFAYQNEDDKETQAVRRMRKACCPKEGLEEQTCDDYTSSEKASLSAQTPQESRNRKRAKRQADLVEQVVGQVNLLVGESEQFYVYQEKGGYYQRIPHCEAYLADLLPEGSLSELDVRDISDIIKRLSWINSIRCDLDGFNYRGELVNLENGVFNMETGELLEHAPNFRFNYVIHANYLINKEDISCPKFEQFCQTSLDSDPKKHQFLLESIGYICTDTNAGKCAFFFKGQPNSGKSVISAFISKLFDPALVSNIALHQLGARFFCAELAGKKLNVAGEIAGRELRDISTFKSVTGNDRMTGEFKREDPFYFMPKCKLLFSGNTLPTTTDADTTAAFLNRIRVLLFNTSVPPEKQDKKLLDKLWAERDSIVTLALKAVRSLVGRNYVFTMPEDSKASLESFKLRGNVIAAFIEDCCELDFDARVFNTELYAAYMGYCTKNSLEPLSKSIFYERLSGFPGIQMKRLRMNGENRWGHTGIRLKEPLNYGTLEQQA